MAERRRERVSAERLAWISGGLAVVAASAIGGVHPTVQVALSVCVLALFATLLWVRRGRGLPAVPFALPLTTVVVTTALQLVPLPSRFVRLVSPKAEALRFEVAPSSWIPLTLDVPGTLLEVVKALAVLGVFTVVARSTQRSRMARALVPIAVAGGVFGALFFAQRATNAQSVLGLYTARDPLGTSVVGTFINGNHGAAFLSLATLVATGLALEASGWRRRVLLTCAAVAAVATIGTASRSGAVGLGVGATAMFAFVLRRRIGMARALAASLVVMVVVTTATLWVADALRSRLTPSSASELVDNPKVRGWRDGLHVARRYLWSGAGRGAFESVVAAERTHDDGVRLVYAENCVIQVLADFGILVGIALIVLFVRDAIRVGRSAPRLDAAALGAACGVLAVAVHELADFSLETLGVALPTAAALGVVAARVTALEEKSAERRRWFWRASVGVAALWPMALAGAAWASSRTLESDVRTVDAAVRAEDDRATEAGLVEGRARHPASDYFELVAARQALRARQPAVALRHLNRALRLHPAGWQGHRLAARALVALGQRRQAALELRLQAETGPPASHDEALKVVGDAIVDSVPQRADELMELARWLARAGKAILADEAARRAYDAVVLHGGDETALALDRLEVATLGGDSSTVRTAAAAVLRGTPSSRVVVRAAEALEAVNLGDEAEATLRRALARNPNDSALLFAAARLSFNRGNATSAIALLKTIGQHPERATIAELRAAEELLARSYDKLGDAESAILARARVRLLDRQLGSIAGRP
jgi:tetratricopeptide (TPR) repeat protein